MIINFSYEYKVSGLFPLPNISKRKHCFGNWIYWVTEIKLYQWTQLSRCLFTFLTKDIHNPVSKIICSTKRSRNSVILNKRICLKHSILQTAVHLSIRLPLWACSPFRSLKVYHHIQQRIVSNHEFSSVDRFRWISLCYLSSQLLYNCCYLVNKLLDDH
jgi:hypothetical protein